MPFRKLHSYATHHIYDCKSERVGRIVKVIFSYRYIIDNKLVKTYLVDFLSLSFSHSSLTAQTFLLTKIAHTFYFVHRNTQIMFHMILGSIEKNIYIIHNQIKSNEICVSLSSWYYAFRCLFSCCSVDWLKLICLRKN